MAKPMQQTEWIERQGLLIWLAEVFSALGTGLYLVSLFVNSWWGALIGWLVIVLIKVPLHFLYLGKPQRFWRTMPPFSSAWKTSWIARGVLFTMLFTGFGLLQLVTSYLLVNSHILTGSALSVVFSLDIILKALAGIFVILTGIYCGFMLSYCKSVPFWNTGILPVVILNAGIADGLALVMAVGLFAGGVHFEAIESVSRIALIINALLIGTYLMNATYQSSTAELSVRELIAGRVAAVFWLGIVVLGILVPLVISLLSLFTGVASVPLLVCAIICHTAGAFALKYGILKVGIHRPILPKGMVY
jgi:formate-dependent nitrite reductase membrane component NrfD